LTARSLGAGSAAVTPCDANGFTIAYSTSHGNVSGVTVGGIQEPQCAGGKLSATLVDASGASIGGGGPVTIPNGSDPASVAVATSPQPAAGSVQGHRITIVGP
jgi:hypothetical protein